MRSSFTRTFDRPERIASRTGSAAIRDRNERTNAAPVVQVRHQHDGSVDATAHETLQNNSEPFVMCLA